MLDKFKDLITSISETLSSDTPDSSPRFSKHYRCESTEYLKIDDITISFCQDKFDFELSHREEGEDMELNFLFLKHSDDSWSNPLDKDRHLMRYVSQPKNWLQLRCNSFCEVSTITNFEEVISRWTVVRNRLIQDSVFQTLHTSEQDMLLSKADAIYQSEKSMIDHINSGFSIYNVFFYGCPGEKCTRNIKSMIFDDILIPMHFQSSFKKDLEGLDGEAFGVHGVSADYLSQRMFEEAYSESYPATVLKFDDYYLDVCSDYVLKEPLTPQSIKKTVVERAGGVEKYLHYAISLVR